MPFILKITRQTTGLGFGLGEFSVRQRAVGPNPFSSFLVIAIILSLFPIAHRVEAYPIKSTCQLALGSHQWSKPDKTQETSSHNVSTQEQLRENLIRTYIALNITYPQMRSWILAGLVAFFLSEPIEIETLTQEFTRDEFNKVFEKMNKAHASYGIQSAVDSDRLYLLIYDVFNISLFGIAERTIKTLAPKTIYGDAFYVFYGHPEFKKEIQFSIQYGRTVLAALKSKEALEIAKSYREKVASNFQESPSSRNDHRRSSLNSNVDESVNKDELLKDEEDINFVGTVRSQILNVVRSRLELNHPELREPAKVHQDGLKYSNRADQLAKILTQNHLYQE